MAHLFNFDKPPSYIRFVRFLSLSLSARALHERSKQEIFALRGRLHKSHRCTNFASLCTDLRPIYAINNFELLFLLNHRTDTCISFLLHFRLSAACEHLWLASLIKCACVCASPIKCRVCYKLVLLAGTAAHALPMRCPSSIVAIGRMCAAVVWI